MKWLYSVLKELFSKNGKKAIDSLDSLDTKFDTNLTTLISDLRGIDNRTLTDLYNKAYDSAADLLKISLDRDNLGLAKDATLSTKLSQSLLTESSLSYDNSAGTTTANYTVFASDIAINFNGKITLQIIMNLSTTIQLKVTPAGQTTAYTGYINEGNALQANSWYEFDFEVNNGDSINVIIQVPAGAILDGYLRIFKRER